MANYSVIVVEDEVIIAEDIRRSLTRMGYAVPEVRGTDPAACNPLDVEGEYDPSNISFKHSLT
ncbi:MAG: hypothetical protein HY259_07310 [Chloroflexi bacterium]|nr:hypothetical protein [Chloroflexota bacterium]MBI3733253.1 hypothetical protein [Chloroflexota bacterium]